MKQSQSSFKEEGDKWYSKTNAIIRLLELAANKKKRNKAQKKTEQHPAAIL
ncbi:MAG: hypothetical protein ACR5K2_01100 [Wolbachia sp.]